MHAIEGKSAHHHAPLQPDPWEARQVVADAAAGALLLLLHCQSAQHLEQLETQLLWCCVLQGPCGWKWSGENSTNRIAWQAALGLQTMFYIPVNTNGLVSEACMLRILSQEFLLLLLVQHVVDFAVEEEEVQ